MAQQVKNPPAMKETQEMGVQSLDQVDPLEKKMATHSHILAWEIPWPPPPALGAGLVLSTRALLAPWGAGPLTRQGGRC